MATKLMLGWSWSAAADHAWKMQWRVNKTARTFTADDGTLIVFARGDELGAAPIQGREFNEIIRGDLPVDDLVMQLAKSRLR